MWKRWMAMSMAALVAAGTLSAVAPMRANAAEIETVKTVRGAEQGIEAAEESYYVLMNIPYAEFYKNELNNNSIDVDAFTSATKNKTRTASLAGGSYHVNSDGSDITGITYPVKVSAGVDLSKYTQLTDDSSVEITVTNRGQTNSTTYKGKDALFESNTYSYYKLSETPSYYKELTVDGNGNLSFSKVKGDITKVSDVDANFTTESRYGDYELDLHNLDSYVADGDTVYGVVIGTKEGTDYGLRHLENIWRRTELSWCTGFTSAVHGCPTSSAHYASMMGQHINKITYYTNKGIYEVAVDDIYVPVKFDTTQISVANAMASTGQVTFSSAGLPSDYEAEYSVNGLKNVKAENGIITFHPESAKPGTYTLDITDKKGKYADVSKTFVLSTETQTVAFDSVKDTLIAAQGFSAEDLENYLNNITSVSVNGKAYSASGRGSVVLIGKDGSIDKTKDPVKETGSYEMVVSATGYPDFAFTFENKDSQEISGAKDAYQVTYGAKSFQIDAKAATALSYKSSDETVVSVDQNGNVSVNGGGKAEITVMAASDDTHKAASKTITVQVAQAAQKISGLKTTYKTTYKKSLLLKAKAKTAVLTVDKNGKVTAKKAGSAYITVSAAANKNYKAANARIKVTVEKASQTIKVKTAVKNYKKSSLKKKAQSFKIGASAQGKITYAVSGKSKKYISVDKTGKVTVKKNTAKGSYSVKVSTKGNSNYKAATKTIQIRVK